MEFSIPFLFTMKTILLLFLTILFFSCGSSKVSESYDAEEENSTKSVFDSNFVNNSAFVYQYTIQLASFESKESAISFIEENRDSITGELLNSFDENKNLYLVQLPVFNSRIKAEEKLAEISKNEIFFNAVMIIKKVNIEY
jgi:hypothetical protein